MQIQTQLLLFQIYILINHLQQMIAFISKAYITQVRIITKSLKFRFCDSKKMNESKNSQSSLSSLAPQSDDYLQKTTQIKFTEQEQQQIKAYKVDPIWNMLLDNQKDYNIQQQLILHKKQYDRSTKQLQAAILFEDLLKTEITILIYDTKVLKIFYIWCSIAAAIWCIYSIGSLDPKNKVLLERTTLGKLFRFFVYGLSFCLFFVSLARYRTFCNLFVQKIVYDTKKEEFTFVKRRFWGWRSFYVASRFKIIYTQNVRLNSGGVNYYDIDTKQLFMITFKDYWIKQDLFSHLISQRIRI